MPEFHPLPILDAHQHLSSAAGIETLMAKGREFGYQAINAVSIAINENGYARNAAGLLMKVRYPGHAYHFGGLQYHLPGVAPDRTDALVQARELLAAGCDGIKMIEGKPTVRRTLKLPLDHPLYMEFYAFMEEQGAPILCHVADPPECWDPERCPPHARQAGWAYDEKDTGFEHLLQETIDVLRRFPRLKMILAHFFFLAHDLPRAHRVMEEHPGVLLDLTPGMIQYPHYRENVEGWREFFLKYPERIVYGTDAFDRECDEDRGRMETVRRFLEVERPFEYGGRKLHGLALPVPVLEKIYAANFRRAAGAEPRTVNRELAVAHCERMAAHARQIADAQVRERITAELEATGASLRKMQAADA